MDDGEVRPVGGRRARKVRVRFLTATDKNLEAAVANGTFDGPLLNRIRRYRIDLPTLAARREDIGSLFLHFLKGKLQATGELDRLAPRQADERPWLGAFDFLRIARAPYPGNLRDLDSLATEIVVDSRGKPFAVFGPGAEKILAVAPLAAPASPLAPVPRRAGQPTDDQIREALRHHRNNIAAAAKMLGISRTTLYDRARLDPSLLGPRAASSCHHGRRSRRMAAQAGVSAEMRRRCTPRRCAQAADAPVRSATTCPVKCPVTRSVQLNIPPRSGQIEGVISAESRRRPRGTAVAIEGCHAARTQIARSPLF